MDHHNEKKLKRKHLLINPKFQLTFLGFMVGLTALTIGLVYCANLYFFWKVQDIGTSLQLRQDHIFFVFLNRQQNMMNWIFLILSAALFTLIPIAGLLFSHQVAGPLYRLQKHFLKSKKSGEYSPVKFRKSDFFQEVATAYNQHLPEGSSGSHHASKEDPKGEHDARHKKAG